MDQKKSELELAREEVTFWECDIPYLMGQSILKLTSRADWSNEGARTGNTNCSIFTMQ